MRRPATPGFPRIPAETLMKRCPPAEIRGVKSGLELREKVPDRDRVDIVIHGGEADRALGNDACDSERSTRRARVHLVVRNETSLWRKFEQLVRRASRIHRIPVSGNQIPVRS